MIIIEDKIVSAEVVEEHFLCNLNACKGACCWEGDFGAPLEPQELDVMVNIYPKIKHLLTPRGIAEIEHQGLYVFNAEPQEFGTPLIDNKACAYMTKDALGFAHCGIELGYNAGLIDFKKPISCHLYPIRTEKDDHVETLNYDRWDICSAACDLGKKEQLPVYKFLKEAIIRKYGEEFYERLDAAAQEYKHWSEE